MLLLDDLTWLHISTKAGLIGLLTSPQGSDHLFISRCEMAGVWPLRILDRSSSLSCWFSGMALVSQTPLGFSLPSTSPPY